MTIRTGRAALRATAGRGANPHGGSEHEHQVALIQWARLMEGRWPALKTLFAVPNGGQRHPAVAAKLRAEGVVSGVPDLILPFARRGHNALALEMKAPGATPHAVTAEQRAWLCTLRTQGWSTHVAFGVDAARAVLTWYLDALTRAEDDVLHVIGRGALSPTIIVTTLSSAPIGGGWFSLWRPQRAA